MTNSLQMHYPSTPTAFFAVGGWFSDKNKNPHFSNTVSGVEYHGKEPHEGVLGTFRGDLINKEIKVPSRELNVHWIQAPIAESCAARLVNITCNSGKFLIFIPTTESRDTSWMEFAEVYASGTLGYAIQCTTAKLSPHDAGTSNGVISVHMEDSFDLEQITQVAYHIFSTLYLIWPSFDEGVLQYMTDRSMFAAGTKEGAMLYSISSRSFLMNPCTGDKTPKSIEIFTQNVLYKLTPKAQARQDMLKDKTQDFEPEEANTSSNDERQSWDDSDFWKRREQRGLERLKNYF